MSAQYFTVCGLEDMCGLHENWVSNTIRLVGRPHPDSQTATCLRTWTMCSCGNKAVRGGLVLLQAEVGLRVKGVCLGERSLRSDMGF